MKKTKLVIYITEVICFITVIFSAYMMFGGERFNKAVRIYAVIQNSDDNENRVLKNGMRDAAKDEGIELIVVDTVRMPDESSQLEVLYREVPKGADGIIIEPAPGIEDPGIFKGITDKNNIVFLKNDISFGNSDYRSVLPDDSGIIKELINKVKTTESNLHNKNVLIVCENSDTAQMQNRIDAVFRELGISNENIIVKELDGLDDEKALLSDSAKADVIIALDNKSTVITGGIADENVLPPRIYGIANSAEAVYLLEKNAFVCLVAVNDYNLGYRSVLAALKSNKDFLENEGDGPQSYYILERENLYSEENENIIRDLSR